MRYVLSLITLLLLSTVVHAQGPHRPDTPPSPQMQALSERVMAEINANISCSSVVFELRAQIAALEKRVAATTPAPTDDKK